MQLDFFLSSLLQSTDIHHPALSSLTIEELAGSSALCRAEALDTKADFNVTGLRERVKRSEEVLVI